MHVETIQPALFGYALYQPQNKNQACFSALCYHPGRTEASQASPFEFAQRHLRRDRAAIGSEGKKARPF